MDVTPPQYLRTSPQNQLAGATRAQDGAGLSRLMGRERRAAAIAAIDIGDTTEETVNVNKTTHEPFKVSEPTENAN